jgi:hypothetical protein
VRTCRGETPCIDSGVNLLERSLATLAELSVRGVHPQVKSAVDLGSALLTSRNRKFHPSR